MKFTIDRSKWRCGSYGQYKKGDGVTQLLNHNGYMCCLGFCSLQLGCKEKDILGHAYPYNVGPSNRNLLNNILLDDDGSTWLSQQATDINDYADYTDVIREQKLEELFKSEGHEIEFIGEYT